MITSRKSRVLEKMRAGQKAISYKLNLGCPRAAEIAAMSGFDAIWICQEHVPTDHSTMCNQILAAKAYGCDCIVRVAKGSYSDYIRPLEADASGIMIPHLMSYEEAQEIVHTVRFQPIGLRPVDGGNADGLYCKLDFKEYTTAIFFMIGIMGAAIIYRPRFRTTPLYTLALSPVIDTVRYRIGTNKYRVQGILSARTRIPRFATRPYTLWDLSVPH